MADIYTQLEQSEAMLGPEDGRSTDGVLAGPREPRLCCAHCGAHLPGGGYEMQGRTYHLTCIPKALGYKGPEDFLVACRQCGGHHPQDEIAQPEGVGYGCLRAYHQREALIRNARYLSRVRPEWREEERARMLRRVEDYWWR